MAGNSLPGRKCQVKDWFTYPVNDGTGPLNAAPSPGVTGHEPAQLQTMCAGFWLPPLPFAPLGHAEGDFAEFQQRYSIRIS
jgi:hypothetical protein